MFMTHRKMKQIAIFVICLILSKYLLKIWCVTIDFILRQAQNSILSLYLVLIVYICGSYRSNTGQDNLKVRTFFSDSTNFYIFHNYIIHI